MYGKVLLDHGFSDALDGTYSNAAHEPGREALRRKVAADAGGIWDVVTGDGGAVLGPDLEKIKDAVATFSEAESELRGCERAYHETEAELDEITAAEAAHIEFVDGQLDQMSDREYRRAERQTAKFNASKTTCQAALAGKA